MFSFYTSFLIPLFDFREPGLRLRVCWCHSSDIQPSFGDEDQQLRYTPPRRYCAHVPKWVISIFEYHHLETYAVVCRFPFLSSKKVNMFFLISVTARINYNIQNEPVRKCRLCIYLEIICCLAFVWRRFGLNKCHLPAMGKHDQKE